jgi:3-methyladenine DNA glycosylase/8-oxoguanine DNA glycosylase
MNSNILNVLRRLDIPWTDQQQQFAVLNSKVDSLLQKTDTAWTENTILRAAYHASREETALLKAAMDTLVRKLNEKTTISASPSPETVNTSTAMQETIMQLSHIQNDIQDVLNAIRNPPGKRKHPTSGQNNEPTMPTNG